MALQRFPFLVLLPWFPHLLSMTCVCNVLHSMRAHALNPRPTEVHVFTSAPLRPFDKDGDGRGQTRRPFPDRRRVGRDLSALVTQGRPLYRARRCNGTRGCVEPAEGLVVSALSLYNLIVPLKGQTIRSRGNMQASAWAFRFRFE